MKRITHGRQSDLCSKYTFGKPRLLAIQVEVYAILLVRILVWADILTFIRESGKFEQSREEDAVDDREDG